MILIHPDFMKVCGEWCGYYIDGQPIKSLENCLSPYKYCGGDDEI